MAIVQHDVKQQVSLSDSEMPERTGGVYMREWKLPDFTKVNELIAVFCTALISEPHRVHGIKGLLTPLIKTANLEPQAASAMEYFVLARDAINETYTQVTKKGGAIEFLRMQNVIQAECWESISLTARNGSMFNLLIIGGDLSIQINLPSRHFGSSSNALPGQIQLYWTDPSKAQGINQGQLQIEISGPEHLNQALRDSSTILDKAVVHRQR